MDRFFLFDYRIIHPYLVVDYKQEEVVTPEKQVIGGRTIFVQGDINQVIWGSAKLGGGRVPARKVLNDGSQ